jgi:flagellar basal-body rod protein FlgB
MYLDRIINQGNGPMLEEWLKFTDARQRMMAEDIVNISTPNFKQQDLSLDKFQQVLGEKVQEQQDSNATEPMNFDDISMDVETPQRGTMFYDGSNRSVDQLMSDQAKNALMHTLAVELLRDQYSQLDMALKERAS